MADDRFEIQRERDKLLAEEAELERRFHEERGPRIMQSSPRLASADRPPTTPIIDLRMFALAQAVKSGYTADPSDMLAFLTQSFLTPLHTLLQSCFEAFLTQDMGDHIALFDRVTTMRDAFGGVLAAMDEMGLERPGWNVERKDNA